MRFHPLLTALFLCATWVNARFCVYYDEFVSSHPKGERPLIVFRWHTTAPSDSSVTNGIDCVIIAFIPSTSLGSQPFTSVSAIKSKFGQDTKVLLAIGGWGDNSGFDQAATTDSSRSTFAQGVASMLSSTGADGVGEFPELARTDLCRSVPLTPLTCRRHRLGISGVRTMPKRIFKVECSLLTILAVAMAQITSRIPIPAKPRKSRPILRSFKQFDQLSAPINFFRLLSLAWLAI